MIEVEGAACNAQLRIARPVSSLEKSVELYRCGLGLSVLARFENHQGFDGAMLGLPGLPYHFEFTFCQTHPVRPAPTPEDLVVFYVPDALRWEKACASMVEAGFKQVASFNPYWDRRGRTFEDHDGYRVVLQQDAWTSP
jgi:catechol 2,3-dioxygenase-like lactoylglutathione lyase family enzyme